MAAGVGGRWCGCKRCGDGHILCADGVSASIPFVILYYRFSRCHHWEEMGKGCTECLYSFNCVRVYNYLKLKSLIIRKNMWLFCDCLCWGGMLNQRALILWT